MTDAFHFKLPACPDCGSPLEAMSMEERQRLEFTCGSTYEREENGPWMFAAQSPLCLSRAASRARISRAPSWRAS